MLFYKKNYSHHVVLI